MTVNFIFVPGFRHILKMGSAFPVPSGLSSNFLHTMRSLLLSGSLSLTLTSLMSELTASPCFCPSYSRLLKIAASASVISFARYFLFLPVDLSSFEAMRLLSTASRRILLAAIAVLSMPLMVLPGTYGFPYGSDMNSRMSYGLLLPRPPESCGSMQSSSVYATKLS